MISKMVFFALPLVCRLSLPFEKDDGKSRRMRPREQAACLEDNSKG